MAGAGILANGVTEILKKLISVVANEITMVRSFNDEFKNLKTTLNIILAVMEDAENKQVTSEEVRLWMEELKSIAYEAEDILDDYSYEIIGERTQTGKVRKPSIVCRSKMAHKINEINEKFNNIAKHKINYLGLQIIDVGSSSSSPSHRMMMNRETYSLVAANWKIVGRENDKSKIINTLLDKDSCLVLAIVGLGGMGKTTMAQLVYNDKVVHDHFHVKIWICVSDPFDVKQLFKNIVNSIGIAEQYDDAATMDSLAHRLQNALRGNKFLLVLDDVWNENPEDWYKFKTPFMVGAEGSKILVTTRNMDVASIMIDKFLPYELEILNKNDSWFLFKEIAFGSVVGAIETPKLIEIGYEMVNRCGGLPLAVIFLGSLMRSKKKEKEWENIRDTKIWHESHEVKNLKHRILPSLRLSYDYLPSHLKQCFSYCCLFPKDWEIQRETLIRLWMAEGFLIESPGENAMSMEEIGNEYFHNLICNFFFQDVVRNKDGDIITCKMHDIVHDLARSVVRKNESLIVENAHDIGCISEATFRLNLVNIDEGMLPTVLEACKNAKNLRTVFLNYPSTPFDIGKAFNENKRLRVLNMTGPPSSITNLSFSIGELKHLRYLHLPKDFIIPKGIGRSRFLQTLNEFNLGDNKNAGGGIEELECLNLLTENLNIDNLQNVTSVSDAFKANLKEKKNLRRLNLTWTSWPNIACKVRYDNHEAVLKGLLPHPNLRTLHIQGFEGSKLPRWIEDSFCLPNLVELTLRGGRYKQVAGFGVAGFGALPSLKFLRLQNLEKLECIDNEFNYSVAAAGGSSSSSTTTTYCFPMLEEIIISGCPLLSTITPTTTIFPSLKVLDLSRIDGRAAKTMVTNNLNSLTSLILCYIPKLITLPRQGLMENNNTLLSLKIYGCYEFKGFLLPKNLNMVLRGGGQQLQISRLQSLTLYDCPNLRFLPNIGSLTSLQELEIQECKESKSLQDELSSLSLTLSSSSSLKHLKYVQIVKNTQTRGTGEVVYRWRRESNSLMHERYTITSLCFFLAVVYLWLLLWWSRRELFSMVKLGLSFFW